LITNLWIKVHGRKGSKEVNPIDLMPEWYKEDITSDMIEKQDVEQMKDVLLAIGVSNKRRRRGDPPIKRKKQ